LNGNLKEKKMENKKQLLGFICSLISGFMMCIFVIFIPLGGSIYVAVKYAEGAEWRYFGAFPPLIVTLTICIISFCVYLWICELVC
jgi:hypothetical protein